MWIYDNLKAYQMHVEKERGMSEKFGNLRKKR